MKGTLNKYLDEWGVLWNCAIPTYAPSRQWTPLHPDDKKQIEQDSLVFDNIEARIAANPEVEFHFHQVWEEVDGETKITKTAKLGPVPKNEYPELEGTNALCEEMIKSREISDKGSNEPAKNFWVDDVKYQELIRPASSQTEISDEEIMEAAYKYAEVYECPSEGAMCKHDIVSAWNKAIQWYREQLKSRQ